MYKNTLDRIEARQRIDSMLAVGELSTEVCAHLNQIADVTPSAQGCEECLQSGDPWVNLRICLICGHVGCCDSSINKHATKHYHSSGHPLIQSLRPGETWIYCYDDDQLVAE